VHIDMYTDAFRDIIHISSVGKQAKHWIITVALMESNSSTSLQVKSVT